MTHSMPPPGTMPDATNTTAAGFPRQGSYLLTRCRVCFDYDTRQTVLGTIVRDDTEQPGRMIIALDDGRYVLSTECQWQPAPDAPPKAAA